MIEGLRAAIPTALTDRELKALASLGFGRWVYEAGALLGASTIALASHARLVVSVDPHDGYPRRDPSPTWDVFAENLRRFHVYGRVQPVRATLADAPPLARYGFAFADLTGQYRLTKSFIDATRHIKLVAVHDYGRTGCEGATLAVDEHLKTARVADVERFDTLIAWRNG